MKLVKEQGITLIALIITIIILIILAAISLQAVFFDGIIEVRGRWSSEIMQKRKKMKKTYLMMQTII